MTRGIPILGNPHIQQSDPIPQKETLHWSQRVSSQDRDQQRFAQVAEGEMQIIQHLGLGKMEDVHPS